MDDLNEQPDRSRADHPGPARAGAQTRARQPVVGAAMAGAGHAGDRARPVPGILLGRPVAGACRRLRAPSAFSFSWCWPRWLRRRWSCCDCRASMTACAGSTAAAARPPAGDRDRRRARRQSERSGRPGALARPCRARADVGAQAQGRLAAAEAVACAIRWRCARWCSSWLVASFFAASGERMKRITAAFDWHGVVAPANFRIDAWVTPPNYTGRPPVMLPGLRPGETAQAAARLRCRSAASSSCALPAM